MAVFKALSQHSPDILVHTKRKIQKRLRDDVVSEATLALSVELCKVDPIHLFWALEFQLTMDSGKAISNGRYSSSNC